MTETFLKFLLFDLVNKEIQHEIEWEIKKYMFSHSRIPCSQDKRLHEFQIFFCHFLPYSYNHPGFEIEFLGTNHQ